LAGESWDRAEAAREALAEHGMTYDDRFGAPHPRPEVQIVRDATIAFSRLIRELDLDTEAPSPPTGRRPPSLRSNRRNWSAYKEANIEGEGPIFRDDWAINRVAADRTNGGRAIWVGVRCLF
jgi:hypothetical protein